MSTPEPAAANAAEINNGLRLAQIFQSGKRLSIKYDSYFQVYERVLSPYVGRPITASSC